MTDTKCAYQGCVAPIQARGYCQTHYMRWYRRNDVEAGMPAHPGICTAEGCSDFTKSRGYCNKHYLRFLRHGSTERRGPSNAKPRPRSSEPIGYIGAHDRIKRTLGPARLHSCTLCGVPAQDWAYDHTDPKPVDAGKGRVFSEDMARYMPLCRPCHKNFDLFPTNVRKPNEDISQAP